MNTNIVDSFRPYLSRALIPFFLFLSACGGSDPSSSGDNNSGDQNVAQQPSAELTNPDDSLMLGAETEDGEELHYYAKKIVMVFQLL